jgi:outer membrane cobalamin receptor
MRQVVVGLDKRLPAALTLRVEAYHRQFDRLLVQRLETERERSQRLSHYELPPDLPPDSALLEYRPTSDPESTGLGRASGLELLLDRNRGRITGWISYTLSKAEREMFGRTVPFDFDRRHAVHLALNVILTTKLRTSIRSQYASGFPITPVHEEVGYSDDWNMHPGPRVPISAPRRRDGTLFTWTSLYDQPRLSLLNSTRLSAYSRTDMRFTYTIDRRLEVYGELMNLFDRENFRLFVKDATGPGLPAHEFQIAPAFPRLFTYGVRFQF